MSLRTTVFTVFSSAAFAAFIIFASPVSAHEYTVVNDAINESLTGVPGDAAAGKKTVIHRKKGNCLACHQMPIPEEQFHGEVGPDLAGVASRYTEGEIRARIVDPKLMNPDTIMPAFHKWNGLLRVLDEFKGTTMLSAQEIEDVVAYMMTLTE